MVVGVCNLTDCPCDGSEVVCKLNPQNCGSDLNGSCCHFFADRSALERAEVVSKVSVPVVSGAVSVGVVPVSVMSDDGSVAYFSPEFDRERKEHLDFLVEQAKSDFAAFRFDAIESSALPIFHKGYTVVGHGKRTNEHCGQFMGFKVCNRTAEHDFVGLNGVNYAGKVFVHKVHASCDKASCPICYRSWASREAENIKQRIFEASKTRGVAEHVIVSLPECDYNLTVEQMRHKVTKILLSRGIVGGVTIWHGFRYSKFDVVRGGIRNMRGFYWSPHFHVIGFLLNSYAKCRGCSKAVRSYVTGGGKIVSARGNAKECAGCDGFEHLVRKLGFGEYIGDSEDGKPLFSGFWFDSKGKRHKADGYIVKITDARKTIKGTAFYQLNHSSHKVDSVRFHVAVWFGSCSYKKFKFTPEFVKQTCPICKHDLIKAQYVGVELLSQIGLFGERDLLCPEFEGNSSVWIAKPELPKKW